MKRRLLPLKRCPFSWAPFMLLLLVALSASFSLQAQEQESPSMAPSQSKFLNFFAAKPPKNNPDWQPDPNAAIYYAAAFPGLGQMYNRRYWKLPIVYGGFAGLGYGIYYNNYFYLLYREGLFAELVEPGSSGLPIINTSIIRNRVDNYRRDRDLFMVLTAAFYMLTIVDAHVDAHFYNFDVSENLAWQMKPYSSPASPATPATTGMSLVFSF